MASLSRGLGLSATCMADGVPTHQAMLLLKVVDDFGHDLFAVLEVRHPRVEGLELEVAVASLTAGLVVLHRRWLLATDAAAGPESRAVWHDLLERFIAGPHVVFTRPTSSEGHHG
ncbi:hypothetical protein GCM10025865_12290 [Paraoerskovia sediminicola]|uniref:Uncharacterized protein n=1 Tax=Paraoerskovia sediminicola TaxID=1138587 RepID=A0ABM8G1C5_9CELL|nr:hypothetical protein [Paraoerskovia sediminicola]BDZ41930.1 hypothetical protein GCM10025865_12290 [Paraoerskovia sediminicola]